MTYPDCATLALSGVEAANGGRERTLILPFDRPTPIDTARVPRLVGARRWRLALRAVAGYDAPLAGLSCLLDVPIDLHAWQLEPALAVLGGRTCRVLMADDVGLGKTIQAGILLAALRRNDEAQHVLVLAPAGLREQWREELTTRCGVPSALVDAHTLRARLGGLPPDVNPWSLPGVWIASFDYLKRPEVLRGVAAVTWDALVIDEAHALTGETERAAAARLIGANARRVLLLTATPHDGDERRFADLCAIGTVPQGRDAAPVWMFRRTRAQVGLASARRMRVLAVRPSAAERRLHEELDRYGRAVWAEADPGGRLAVIVLKKRAYSSAGSLARSLARRLGALGAAGGAGETQLALPFSSHGSGETDDRDDEPRHVLAAPGLRDAGGEQAWLRALLALAREAARRESKLLALGRLLARSPEPVIIFTEYRDTLARLGRAVTRVTRAVVVHGGLSAAQRQQALGRFTRGEARVLLATDAAGEGLNLQARCRWVIALELPWSPRRLEQRIGRVDRIGQTRRVHAVLLVARHTAETEVLGRLVSRLEQARARLGETDGGRDELADAEIAAAVVERRVVAGQGATARASESTAPGVPPGGPPSARVHRGSCAIEARAECERLTILRLLRRAERSADATPAAPGVFSRRGLLDELERRRPWMALHALPTRPAGDRALAGLLCVVQTTTRDGRLREVDSRILAVVLPADTSPVDRSARSLRRWIDRQVERRQSDLIEAVRGFTDQRRRAVSRLHAGRAALGMARELDLLRALDLRTQARLVQASLFDREAVRAAQVEIELIERRRAALRERLRELQASMALRDDEPAILLCTLARVPNS